MHTHIAEPYTREEQLTRHLTTVLSELIVPKQTLRGIPRTTARRTTTTPQDPHRARRMKSRRVRNHPQNAIPEIATIEPRKHNKTREERTRRGRNEELAPRHRLAPAPNSPPSQIGRASGRERG